MQVIWLDELSQWDVFILCWFILWGLHRQKKKNIVHRKHIFFLGHLSLWNASTVVCDLSTLWGSHPLRIGCWRKVQSLKLHPCWICPLPHLTPTTLFPTLSLCRLVYGICLIRTYHSMEELKVSFTASQTPVGKWTT